MSSTRSAIHLRTGEAAVSQAVDAWLQTHKLQSRVVADVYEACVYLVQHSEDVPDLAFVGADRLAADEFGILRYLRQTWPAVAIVVYSASKNVPLCEPEPLRCVCYSQGSLQRLLKDPPDQLLAQLRSQLGESNQPLRPEAPAAPEVNDAQYAPPSSPPQQSDDQAQKTVDETLRRAVLTEEELAALLGEDEN